MAKSDRMPDALLTRAQNYMQVGEFAEAVYLLRRYLSAPDAVWPDARCDAMLLLARCHQHTGNRTEAERWILRACAEQPQQPQPWLEAAAFYEPVWSQAAAVCASRAMTVRI